MANNEAKKILITGASGFIGSFAVERALELGFEVWAAVRKSSSHAWLSDARIRFIQLDMSNQNLLQEELITFKQVHGKWDYIIHAAGITKAKNKNDSNRINHEGTSTFAHLLQNLDMIPTRFIFISSLSVCGAIHEELKKNEDGMMLYPPISSEDTPRPNTEYGKSKLSAEKALTGMKGFPVVILRPTGVYGPREKDYFLMVKSIQRHIDCAVGMKAQEITFIYVKDLVEAMFLAINRGDIGGIYHLSDGKTYNSRTFGRLIQKELKINYVLRITIPLCVLRLICCISEKLSLLTNKPTIFNNDKYNILKQRNWCCNIRPAQAIGFQPQYDLKKGVKQTIAWYKQEKWI